MSENKHTPEPWRQEGLTILCADGHIIFRMDVSFYLPEERKEAARRIVACVNACAGIPTDQLESGEARYVRNELADIYALEKQRDELLAALEKGGHSLREISLWDKTTAKDVAMAKAAYAEVKAAIASVKGGAA